MTVNCMSWQGRLFVSCSQCEPKAWSSHAVEDPRGRIQIGDAVYPVTLRRIVDPDELESVWQARARKIGEDDSEQRPNDRWSFELSLRQVARQPGPIGSWYRSSGGRCAPALAGAAARRSATPCAPGDGTMQLYDSIGHGYRERRKQDPRIAERIDRALGSSECVVNVGAGAGSYEPRGRKLVAVEPSRVMIRQRPPEASPVVRASATDLPFRDESFDASLAILTLHHWPDPWRGIEELRRVARSTVVILTFDTSVGGFWLTDYFPDIPEIDRRSMPDLSAIERHLGTARVFDVPIPHDCTDGFLGAYWRRPHAYLDEGVRSAISTFSRIGGLEPGLARLRADLASGSWRRRYGHLSSRSELDLGYRLVVAGWEGPRPARAAAAGRRRRPLDGP